MQSRTSTAMVLAAGIALHTTFAPLLLLPQQSPGELKGGGVTVTIPQNFRWQRIITPPPSGPLAEACVVLDADTFANAAPALRDLRLYQDGHTVPYAIEQSYDERAVRSGITTADDRSFYETSAIGTLQLNLPAGVAGDGIRRDSLTYRPLKPDEIDPILGSSGNFSIPSHVPVERIHVEPAPLQAETLEVFAELPHPALANAQPRPGDPQTETAKATINPTTPAMPFTLGANLQNAAKVFVVVKGSAQPHRRVLFEMRRRSLCYQPRSASPLLLYLGGGITMPAESYAFARTFQSDRDRATATLGPLLPNPLFHPQTSEQLTLNRNMRLTIAILALIALFLFNIQRLRKYKRSPAPQQGSSA